MQQAMADIKNTVCENNFQFALIVAGNRKLLVEIKP